MPSKQVADIATAEAEQCLRAELKYNRQNNILRSENRIIERLLAARGEIRAVYHELARHLSSGRERCTVLRSLVTMAAFWNRDKTKTVRDQLGRAERLNRAIEEKARELASLLRMRSESCGDVYTPDDYHPLHLIDRAALTSHEPYKVELFRFCVKEHLDFLRHDFDLKYWPGMDQVLDALADTQTATKPQPHDPAMRAAVSARTHSDADFIRAWLFDLHERTGRRHGWDIRSSLPKDFRLSHEAMARCANAALGLDPPMSAGTVGKRRKVFEKELSDSSPENI